MYKFLAIALTLVSVSLPAQASNTVQDFVDNYAYFTCAYFRGGASYSDGMKWGSEQAFAKAQKTNEVEFQALVRAFNRPDFQSTISRAIALKLRADCGNVVQLKR